MATLRSRARAACALTTGLALLMSGPLQAAPPTPVTLSPLSAVAIHPERSAPAVVESLNDAELSAEITARIEQLAVRVGDEVSKGDLLVRLDCRDHESRLAAAKALEDQLQAQRRLAASQVDRAQSLVRSRSASQEEVERRESELAVIDAQIAAQREAIAQARLNVARCEVRAPYRAAVAARLAAEGALAAAGTPLVRLVETDEIEVSAALRPEELNAVREAAALHFQYLGTQMPVQLRRALPVVDKRTRTVDTRLTFTGSGAPPGASGRLVWSDATPHVPGDLLVRRGGRLGVLVADDGTARFVPIDGAQEGQPAPLSLPAGTRVVVEGRERLNDGDPVNGRE
jgi:RND family efflux transporter MFP subunit